MRWVGAGFRLAGQLALAASALGLGMAVSRYTDLARYDRTRLAPSVLRTTPLAHAAELAAGPALPSTARLLGEAAAADQPGPARDGAEPSALGEAFRDGRIMRGTTPHRLILFTFDDGPDRTTTPLLLDRLDAAGVRAVFFLTGDNLRGDNLAERKNQEIARETARRGHLVASHGMHHLQLPLLSDAEVLSEVEQTEAMFEHVLGGRPWLMRPPGGARSARVDRLLAQRGYTTVLWNLGAGDFQVRTAAEVHKIWSAVFERRRAHGEEGGIVLLHDTYAWSIDAFQLIVQDLLNRNCGLLAKNEELYDFADDPRPFFQPRAGADPSAEAAPVLLPETVIEERQARLREETAQRCHALAVR